MERPHLSGGFDSRLAEHGMARRAGRHQPRPIPTEDFMKRQIRTLAGYKVNLFALYMEHVFDFASQPLVAPKESRAHSAGNQRSSGLCQAALRHNSSRTTDLRASPSHLEVRESIPMSRSARMGMCSRLRRSGRTISLRLCTLIWCRFFPGPFLHVGGMRLSNWGTDKLRAGLRKSGWGGFISSTCRGSAPFFQPYHKQLMFWGDIALKYPHCSAACPKI